MIDSNLGKIADQFFRDMQSVGPALDRAGQAGAAAGARKTRDVLRQQVTASGLPRKLASTVRDRVYTENERTGNRGGRDAAGFVWSKAPEIMQAGTLGADITPKTGRYLALPTKVAVTMRLHRTGRRNKANFDAAKSRFPLLVQPRNGNRVVFAVGVIRVGDRIRKARKGELGTKVALFILVRAAKWKARLDPVAAARAGQDAAMSALDKNLK